ncbi:16S rRNA (uracil(1498)-N(3))-methyltransferase [Xylophilus sp.]|uniref:16S rRNA (uracil(1498)-N(3))-methyltransferase n=1 Tax=Xylophilus sp. TaxID=2653893 RepID=UPI0013BB757E|nr:16S rRNA (uracil(1498)-N(3))-methyltransferase [Xylophilus sp.]KAF1044086.1 MAG: Ribosomal RNA small subunit methyltransferase E [Xylophilus sp.]
MPRIHCATRLSTGIELDLPSGAARHVQVLRLQLGDTVTLFDGAGGEYTAGITHMGRADVRVRVGAHDAVEREARRAIHIASGMPANERMDWLVEKAAELGAASLQPLAAARSVLRLSGERAGKKQAHWQGVAIAACEQCGRNRVPTVHAVRDIADWLRGGADGWPQRRLLLSLREGSRPLREAAGDGDSPVLVLHGPEGGLAPHEEDAALAAGFAPVTLGPRVLRAETAPLAVLAALG